MKSKLLALSVALLTGCANTGQNYRPIVDLAGRDSALYERSLRECQDYAGQLAGAANQAAVGVVIGALAGAAISALLGGGRADRNRNSMIGAISGGASAGAEGEQSQRNVIRRCLTNRGFSVLH